MDLVDNRIRLPSRAGPLIRHTLGVLGAVVGVAAAVGCGDGVAPEVTVERRCPLPDAGASVGGVGGTRPDAAVQPVRRLVLMGGAAEDDTAARAFVEAAAGGDVLVLRASGSLTSYPDYFTSTLSPDPAPNSVLTVSTTTPASGGHPGVLCLVGQAEAVWLAGGDQWNYLGLWPPELRAALTDVAERGGVVGGTSAGAMSLGHAAFDAREGTVSSADALSDPLGSAVSVSYPVFSQPELMGALVDTHFSERGREGRLLAFLARFAADQDLVGVLGIGLDEGVAFVIEGGAFTVRTEGAGSAWLYRLEAVPQLRTGEPLNLDAVLRIRLPSDEGGDWPPDMATPPVDTLHVADGVVGEGPAGG